MNKRGSTGRSLVDRTAARAPDVDRLRRRHCWVLGTDAGDRSGRESRGADTPGGGPWPGLVAEWRRAGDGWQARVVYVVGESTRTAEEWVPQERLRPGSWPDSGR